MSSKNLHALHSAPRIPSRYASASKRWLRLLGVCILAFVVSALCFTQRGHRHRRVHHAPFTPPDSGTVVHGKIVDEQPQFIQPPNPFPYSPMSVSQRINDEHRPWLAAVICAAADTEHRMLIRSTWMQLFHDVPFDGRFVVSNPGQWTDLVAKENSTFGDMIVLDRLQEDDITANTVKTLEFYRWLVESGRKYEFVSKMDTDLWLNARLFWDKYLEPNLSNSTGTMKATIERTIIGELYYTRSWDLVFAHGSMYTVTWDMVELLVSLQDRFNVVTGEDMAVASLLLKGREMANFINFRGSEKFDYDDRDSRGDGTAWAREKTNGNAIMHAIGSRNTIAVHNLKNKEHWVKVADCFDEHGLKKPPPPRWADRTPVSLQWQDLWAQMGFPSKAHKSRFQGIPNFLWTFQHGSWVCDGIWRLGRTKTGYLDA
ncbi:hypothetical protein HJFPF1_07353 [Paramyrothecium foliicola]|nr:hypothetical protein HJFPF1_07353 [Paramyrothecium foliicola]